MYMTVIMTPLDMKVQINFPHSANDAQNLAGIKKNFECYSTALFFELGNVMGGAKLREKSETKIELLDKQV